MRSVVPPSTTTPAAGSGRGAGAACAGGFALAKQAMPGALIGLAALAMLIMFAAPAAAKPARGAPPSTWVAIVQVTGAAPSTWAARLHEAARGAPGERTWAPPPALAVNELQVALGCAAWDAACVGQVAEAAGAGKALTLTLAPLESGGLALDARVVDVGGEVVTPPVRLALPGAGADDLRVAEAWVKGVVASGAPTMLVVTSDLDGDDVLVDGVVVGQTPLVLPAVAPGEHALSLRRAGRAPLVRRLVVKAGVVHREHAPFAAGPPALGASSPLSSLSSPSSLPATAGWAVAGAGAVLGGVGAIVAAAWGVPLVEIGNNQVADAAGRAVIARRYTTLDGRTLEGDARLAHLRSALFLPSDAPIHDDAVLGAALAQAVTTANTGFVLVAAGALLGVTGVAMALLAPEDGAGPPASPSPSSSSSPASPAAP